MSLLSKRETRRRLLRGFSDSTAVAAQLAVWFETPLGDCTLQCEKALCFPIIERMFGYHILQIGGCEKQRLIDASPISHKIMFSSEYRDGLRSAVADNQQLPLESDGIDAVIIHHGLDFADDSHALLREATRVLRPGGQMLIVGFNPLSQWGLIRLFQRKIAIPWVGKFIVKRRLLDWLQLLDLKVDSHETGVFIPPFQLKRVVDNASRIEQIAKKVRSPFGGVYVISCIKQVAGVTPIMPKWKPVRSRASTAPVAENFRSKLH